MGCYRHTRYKSHRIEDDRGKEGSFFSYQKKNASFQKFHKKHGLFQKIKL